MNGIAAKKVIITSAPAQRGNEAVILKVLAYFDIFHYPLTREEILNFAAHSVKAGEMDSLLEQLTASGTIFYFSGVYTLHNNPMLAHRRKGGNNRAKKLLPKAYQVGRFLYKFPFVRAIGISGSLSKNFADENADIDFFIVTKADRLWIARTIMHFFKKLTFLSGHQHYFCMNYYIDEKALVIGQQNIFTAMEIVTLLPVAGKAAMKQFREANDWAYHLFPCFSSMASQPLPDTHTGRKRFFEWLFDHKAGDRLDNWLLKITSLRWRQKNNKGIRNKNGYAMQLETGKHFSRSNPGAFQEKVLALYEQKLAELKLI